ncbi:MAG: PorV/PorQ family protein [Bacteroidota bacterium]
MAFLKFGFGARNVAMSDLGVVEANDLTALNYNPSLLAINNKTQLSFTYNSLFQGLNSEMFAGSFNAFGLPLAIGVNTTSVADIEIRTRPGAAESKFNANYFFASVSTAYNLFENFYAGATFKYIYENLFSDNANGMGFDIGFSYQKLIGELTLGAAIRNIGSMNELRTEATKLPTDIRFGAAYNFSYPDYKLDFTSIAGFQKYTAQDDSHMHFGAEAVYDRMFALRFGYVTGYDSKNISLGFGVNWNNINLDFTHVPVKYGLGDSHIITIIYSFE